jgi:hypothetical protein
MLPIYAQLARRASHAQSALPAAPVEPIVQAPLPRARGASSRPV